MFFVLLQLVQRINQGFDVVEYLLPELAFEPGRIVDRALDVVIQSKVFLPVPVRLEQLFDLPNHRHRHGDFCLYAGPGPQEEHNVGGTCAHGSRFTETKAE